MLDHNELWDYPVWSLTTSLPRLARLSVGENSWPCDCLTVRNIQQLSLLTLLSDSNVACTTLSGNISWTCSGQIVEGEIVINFTAKQGKNCDIFHTPVRGRYEGPYFVSLSPHHERHVDTSQNPL